MQDYLDKATLYERIEEHRNKWGINLSDYPINAIELCDSFKYIVVKEAPFKTLGLRGIATKRDCVDKSDIILLNSNRTDMEKNFDCSHELIHLTEHRKSKTQTFHCFEKVRPQQNAFLEWQANEGAAEMLVPYRQFLPLVKENHNVLNNWDSIWNLRCDFAKYFNVTESVIKIRFESLKYEIDQFLAGCHINDLKILSAAKQKQLGIKIQSINDIATEDMDKMFIEEYVSDDEKELLDRLRFGE